MLSAARVCVVMLLVLAAQHVPICNADEHAPSSQPVTESTEVATLRDYCKGMASASQAFHIEYTLDKVPFDESSLVDRNLEAYIKKTDLEKPGVKAFLEQLRQQKHEQMVLDATGKRFLSHKQVYSDNALTKALPNGEEWRSFDLQHVFMLFPSEHQGTSASDAQLQAKPENPIGLYMNILNLLGNTRQYQIVSVNKPKLPHLNAKEESRQLVIGLKDSLGTDSNHIYEVLVDVKAMHILQFMQAANDDHSVLRQTLFRDFKTVDIGSAEIQVPSVIVCQNTRVPAKYLVAGAEEKWLDEVRWTLNSCSPTKLHNERDYGLSFPKGTTVWIKDLNAEYSIQSDGSIRGELREFATQQWLEEALRSSPGPTSRPSR